MRSAVTSILSVIERAGASAGIRPRTDRWSILEYGGHLRDALLSARERVILTSILDHPVGTPIYRDERIDLGFYSEDTALDVTQELRVAEQLFSKTISTLPAGFETRRLVYSARTPIDMPITGVVANALHECEHHLADVNEDLALLSGDQ
jgi:hypothetical protein